MICSLCVPQPHSSSTLWHAYEPRANNQSQHDRGHQGVKHVHCGRGLSGGAFDTINPHEPAQALRSGSAAPPSTPPIAHVIAMQSNADADRRKAQDRHGVETFADLFCWLRVLHNIKSSSSIPKKRCFAKRRSMSWPAQKPGLHMSAKGRQQKQPGADCLLHAPRPSLPRTGAAWEIPQRGECKKPAACCTYCRVCCVQRVMRVPLGGSSLMTIVVIVGRACFSCSDPTAANGR